MLLETLGQRRFHLGNICEHLDNAERTAVDTTIGEVFSLKHTLRSLAKTVFVQWLWGSPFPSCFQELRNVCCASLAHFGVMGEAFGRLTFDDF